MAKTDDFLYVSQTADIVPFRIRRIGDEAELQILLIRRSEYAKAEAGKWALPGGFMDKTDGDVYQTAVRELREETGLDATRLNFVGVYTEKGRDPRGPVHSVAVAAYFDYEKSKEAKAGDDAKDAVWFCVKVSPPKDEDPGRRTVTLYSPERHLLFKLDCEERENGYGMKENYVSATSVMGGSGIAFDHAKIIDRAIPSWPMHNEIPEWAKEGAK